MNRPKKIPKARKGRPRSALEAHLKKLESQSSSDLSLDRPRWRLFVGFPRFNLKADKPYPGAQLTVRQVVNGGDFAVHTGSASGYITAQQASASGIAFSFTLGDMSQFVSFTSVFDQYRFETIEVFFIASQNMVGDPAAQVQGAIPLVIVADYDDDSTPSSSNAMKDYDNIQMLAGYQSGAVKIVPHNTLAAYASSTFSGYTSASSPETGWLDCASVSIKHYGIKGYIEADSSSTAHLQWYTYAIYTVSFKNVR